MSFHRVPSPASLLHISLLVPHVHACAARCASWAASSMIYHCYTIIELEVLHTAGLSHGLLSLTA